jgi:serine/threonine-protein kinase
MDGESVLRPGYRLDRYELLCPIASGGMASVWLARLRGKRDFEKLYAVKTIKTELGEDTRFQEMFLDEARLASGIEHPNVAHILDLGEHDGILYIVMEYVDGEALAKVARQARKVATPLPLGHALRIIADACAGLHAAHELKDRAGQNLGVVHRDVSPQNILIAMSGAVKVIDFGVAKASNRRAGETGEGVVKGKIRFMAPEQVRAQPLDRRADIWAIGVCLHELATGRLPYDDDSDIDVVRRLISDEPPPRLDGVPAPVAELLSHSLVRDPNERFSTAAAMRRAIENAMTELHLQASSEDVADFVRVNLPEFAEKRHKVMAKATDEADRRAAERGSTSLVAAEEVVVEDAFAPTVMSKAGESGASSIADRLTRPDPKPTARNVTRARDVLEGRVAADESVGGAFTDEEVAALPKKRGVFWLVALAAMAAGAWFVWPGDARIRATFARIAPTTAAAVPTATTSAMATAGTTASVSASVSASANATLATSATVASSALLGARDAAPIATQARPRPTSQDVTFSPAPPLVTATATQAAPTQTATTAPPEENNPY